VRESSLDLPGTHQTHAVDPERLLIDPVAQSVQGAKPSSPKEPGMQVQIPLALEELECGGHSLQTATVGGEL
jgi:hypothetical protein